MRLKEVRERAQKTAALAAVPVGAVERYDDILFGVELRGCLVSIDAVGYPSDLAQQICTRGADCLCARKAINPGCAKPWRGLCRCSRGGAFERMRRLGYETYQLYTFLMPSNWAPSHGAALCLTESCFSSLSWVNLLNCSHI